MPRRRRTSLGPAGGEICGDSVTFSFGITASTCVVAFFILLQMQGPQRSTVVITEAVDICY
ncbi:MAG TPA: hypothetical protein VEY12_09700 [Thermoplasmata archaeon]|nr:hypothetical protein [Thermoplasmata archaeon]